MNRHSTGQEVPNYRVSVAPMMEYTDRHCRYFLRRITRRTLLYTEMITSGAIIHGDRDRLLGFHSEEHPLALQIGGDDPAACAESVRIASTYGYDEYNLNVGCPSDRVQEGSFGACLMARPQRVAQITRAMKDATDRPVTVKHRIGISGRESYDQMRRFVEIVAEAGAERLIVHARIAVLGGLSPKENRSVPPLRYEDVYRLKRELPQLTIVINGQIVRIEQMCSHLARVDGVMIGRAAYDNPWLFAEVDREFYSDPGTRTSRAAVIDQMIPYVEQVRRESGRHPRTVLRHMLGLFAFQPGAGHWKRTLSGPIEHDVDIVALLEAATASVPQHTLGHVPTAV
ncbi:MAG: tRNA dihydrouridine(20/20a) synthase DusA [Spirochaetaceae bacterium]|nr:MAG: tRNA dihydrouridine(20/20a) synthase DusA [Spirochaetaceae bacterium]